MTGIGARLQLADELGICQAGRAQGQAALADATVSIM